jgi:hypothetical protein
VVSAADSFALRERDGKELTLEAMKDGIAPDLLGRMLIIEFGVDASEFLAVVPERYIYRGQDLLWRDSGDPLN